MKNQPRGTPGMLLGGFACALLLSAVATFHTGAKDEARPLTGLGDSAFYDGKLSADDFFNPVLVFPAAPKGLYRRSIHPVHRDDSKMIRSALDASLRHIIYTDAKPKPAPDGKARTRWYLKASPNHYIEFGERKYFETFEPGKK